MKRINSTMKFNKNKIKELRYTDYQVVAERSVGVKAANTVFNEYNQTIFAHDLKWNFHAGLCHISSGSRPSTVTVSGLDELLKVDKTIGECTAIDLLFCQRDYAEFEFVYKVERALSLHGVNELSKDFFDSGAYFYPILRFLKPKSMHKSAGGTPETVVLEAAGRRFTESRAMLITGSDFFAAMFAAPMAEQNADVILIGEIDSASVFGDFLDVLGGRALPNPENVAELAALADRFQASGVAKSCALHLMSYAVEIPFIDRLYIAQRFRLAGVCTRLIGDLEMPALRQLCEENASELANHPDLQATITARQRALSLELQRQSK